MPIQPFQIAPAPVQQNAQVTDPVPGANQGTFYTKEVSGTVEGFFTNGTGDVIQITQNGTIAGGSQVFEKPMRNDDRNAMPAGMPVSIKSNGAIVPGDSDTVDGQQPVGITLETIAAGAYGKVALFGRNIPGILTGMGFNSADTVFLGETGGNFVKSPSTELSGDDDSYIQMGIAAAADGTVGNAATDLILIRQVITNA